MNPMTKSEAIGRLILTPILAVVGPLIIAPLAAWVGIRDAFEDLPEAYRNDWKNFKLAWETLWP